MYVHQKRLADQNGVWNEAKPPLLRFLADCHHEFSSERGGGGANYIPELSKANPHDFGIALATLMATSSSRRHPRPFTIQSVSKGLVFALALETLGAEHVEGGIGVEPSGDAFNSIRLNADNHRFNPMVNAGAIAVSELIHEAKGADAFESIRHTLCRFAERDLGVDESVYASEPSTGDRNRAIDAFNVTAILSGVEPGTAVGIAISEWTPGLPRLRTFHLLDDAIEWAEDQIVYRHAGMVDNSEITALAEQSLLEGLSPAEIAALAALGTFRNFPPGRHIIAAGGHAASLFPSARCRQRQTAQRHPTGDPDRWHDDRRNGAAGYPELCRCDHENIHQLH